MLNIRVLLPTYRMVDVAFMKSLLVFQAQIFKNGDAVSFAITNHADIAAARNGLVKTVKKDEDIDYVVFVDSDMIFEAQDMYNLFERLETNDLLLLSAKYYVRNSLGADRKLAMCNWSPEHKKFVKITPEPSETGLKRCDTVGLGLCVVKPQLIEELRAVHGDDLFAWKKDMGEDSYFCHLVRSLGHRITYDCDTIAGHISQVINK